MTIADLMPVRIGLLDRKPRVVRKHRAPDECERLRFLLFGANLCIRGLHLQLDDKDREHAETVARIDERHAEIVRGLEAQVIRLQRRLEVGVLAEAAATETQEIDTQSLQERFAHGPVVALNQTPMARRSPGHVPGWVKDQPDPAA